MMRISVKHFTHIDLIQNSKVICFSEATGTKRLCNLPDITQLLSIRARPGCNKLPSEA